MSEDTAPLNSMERPQLLAQCLQRGREISRLHGELELVRASVADASDSAVDPVLSIMIDEFVSATDQAHARASQARHLAYRMQDRRAELREAIEGRLTPDDDA